MNAACEAYDPYASSQTLDGARSVADKCAEVGLPLTGSDLPVVLLILGLLMIAAGLYFRYVVAKRA